MTPRKLILLYEQHAEFNGWKKVKRKEDTYIDEVSWL